MALNRRPTVSVDGGELFDKLNFSSDDEDSLGDVLEPKTNSLEKSRAVHMKYRTFEDARKTTEKHITLRLVERGMMALSIMSLSVSLMAKEIEIQKLVTSSHFSPRSQGEPRCHLQGLLDQHVALLSDGFDKHHEELRSSQLEQAQTQN